MNKKHFGERSGYIIIISIFLLLVNVTLGVIMINLSSKAITAQIEGRMLDIANTAADMMVGDELEKLTKEDADTQEYQNAIKTLERFQDNIQLEYIYCIQVVGDKEFAFSVDPTKNDPGEFGAPIVYTDALYKASLGEAAVDKKPYEDSWGRFYSAYSPVFDSDGNVAGIVAVDYSADWYEEQVHRLIRSVLIICVLSILAGGLIVFLIMERTRRRNRRLYAELSSLADNVEDFVNEVRNSTNTELSQHTGSDYEASGDDIRDLSKKIHVMQDNLRSEISSVHRIAYIDALTGAGNTTAYNEVVDQLNSQIEAGTAVFSISAFDLNGLKKINDNFGHDNGDKMLIDTAAVIIRVYGKENVYRVGGDEFIAILSTDSSEEPDSLFEQFDRELEKENKKEKTYQYPISVSKGYSVYQKEQDHEYKSVFRRADEAMYRDKDAYYEKNDDSERR